MTPAQPPWPESRSAYVPGFSNDIFISHAHIDNVIEDEELQKRGWVDRFVRRLDVQLLARLLAQQAGLDTNFFLRDRRSNRRPYDSSNLELDPWKLEDWAKKRGLSLAPLQRPPGY